LSCTLFRGSDPNMQCSTCDTQRARTGGTPGRTASASALVFRLPAQDPIRLPLPAGLATRSLPLHGNSAIPRHIAQTANGENPVLSAWRSKTQDILNSLRRGSEVGLAPLGHTADNVLLRI